MDGMNGAVYGVRCVHVICWLWREEKKKKRKKSWQKYQMRLLYQTHRITHDFASDGDKTANDMCEFEFSFVQTEFSSLATGGGSDSHTSYAIAPHHFWSTCECIRIGVYKHSNRCCVRHFFVVLSSLPVNYAQSTILHLCLSAFLSSLSAPHEVCVCVHEKVLNIWNVMSFLCLSFCFFSSFHSSEVHTLRLTAATTTTATKTKSSRTISQSFELKSPPPFSLTPTKQLCVQVSLTRSSRCPAVLVDHTKQSYADTHTQHTNTRRSIELENRWN